MDLHFKGINSTTNVITDDIMIHRELDRVSSVPICPIFSYFST